MCVFVRVREIVCVWEREREIERVCGWVGGCICVRLVMRACSKYWGWLSMVAKYVYVCFCVCVCVCPHECVRIYVSCVCVCAHAHTHTRECTLELHNLKVQDGLTTVIRTHTSTCAQNPTHCTQAHTTCVILHSAFQGSRALD